jgi:2-phospho-L-lactate/phosphoenolpyruvate guanylyltransferase
MSSACNDGSHASYSDAVDAVREAAADVAVLVPVKSFHAAKARLASDLAPDVRHALARWMATQVVEAVRPLPTFVACDDDEVAEWADALGASVLWGPGLGLNGAVDEGVVTISGKGFHHVVITHGDLPLPRSLPATVQRDTIVLVPDRRRDGTNVVARPCSAALPASYGGGSFDRHLAHALASSFPVTVRVDAHLSLDLDDPADLRHPLVWPVICRALAW